MFNPNGEQPEKHVLPAKDRQPMKVIGAGFGRTGTSSMVQALHTLGYRISAYSSFSGCGLFRFAVGATCWACFPGSSLVSHIFWSPRISPKALKVQLRCDASDNDFLNLEHLHAFHFRARRPLQAEWFCVDSSKIQHNPWHSTHQCFLIK